METKLLLVLFYSDLLYRMRRRSRCVRHHSAAGNRTRVFRVTGGNTNHYTTADLHFMDHCIPLGESKLRTPGPRYASFTRAQ